MALNGTQRIALAEITRNTKGKKGLKQALGRMNDLPTLPKTQPLKKKKK